MAEKNAHKYRDQPEALDYLVGSIGLGLIIAMMVALAFFLLARISLSSAWTAEHWIFFWEVLGTVLVCRMFLIDEMKRQVGQYAFVFGLVVWVPFAGFALMEGDYKVGSITTVAMIIIGWLTFKITWDVTDLGEREEDEDGFLASIGFKKDLNPGKKQVAESWGDTREEGSEYNFEAEEVLKDLAKEKPKKPKGGKGRGLWVLYFLFGSIPVFGLGGSTSNSSEPGLGKYYMLCLAVYLSSCVGLLMTTSFLTIRKDLRRRNLSMPLFTSGFWLLSGAALLVACFLFAGVLPRPQGVTDPVAWVKGKQEDREASEYSKSSKNAGKGEGNPGEKSGEKGSTKEGSSKERQKSDSKDGKGNAKDGSDSKGAKGKSEGKSNDSDNKEKGSSSQGKQKGDGKQDSSSNRPPQNPPSQSPQVDIPGLDKFMESLAVFIKVVFAIGTLLFILYVVVYKMSFQMEWAQDFLSWLRGLFGWFEKPKKKEDVAQVEEPVQDEGGVEFRDYTNPFSLDGWQKISLRQLTGYTWKALLVWCRSRNLKIPEGCTPLELAEIIGQEEPRVEAVYYAFQQVLLQVQYGNVEGNPRGVGVVRKMWAAMEGESVPAGAEMEE